jgi:pyoverdine/dityrosine biosynthesis protein Dit1
MIPKILTKQKFSAIIEDMVVELDCTHSEAILNYCANNEFEVESAAKLLNDTIKLKIEVSAREKNLLKKIEGAKLPL